MDPAYPCKVSNDEGVNPIVFVQGIKGFLIFSNLLGIQAVNFRGERSQLFTGGKIVGNMDTIEPGGFQTDDDKAEFVMLILNIRDHLFHVFRTILGIWDGAHFNEEFLLKV